MQCHIFCVFYNFSNRNVADYSGILKESQPAAKFSFTSKCGKYGFEVSYESIIEVNCIFDKNSAPLLKKSWSFDFPDQIFNFFDQKKQINAGIRKGSRILKLKPQLLFLNQFPIGIFFFGLFSCSPHSFMVSNFKSCILNFLEFLNQSDCFNF